MPPLNLLIKPASGNCNLRCKYCFYHSITEKREVKSYGMMNEETLEVIVKKALNVAEGSCTFAFQGGEPTLIGIQFYRKLIDLQKKYNHKKINIFNALQTNGINIDDEWAQFLSENNFLVGISLDGPKELHDLNRIDIYGSGTYNKVMKAICLFNKYKVEYNVLFVVTGASAKHANKIYKFFKKNDFRYIQFIPCLDPLNEERGKYNFSLKPEIYEVFLKNMFDLWYDDLMKNDYVSIRYFDNLIKIIMGQKPEACGMNGCCSCQFVVEADGGVYPCDFYVIDKWFMGNLKNEDFTDLINSEAASKFIKVSQHIDNKCLNCEWLKICRGGCRRDREPFVNDNPSLNYFCSSYEGFFKYSLGRLINVAQIIKSQRR